jgi:multidrug efflux pump subunit AcrB
MRLTHFFIDRPRFATVLSIFVTLLGLGALAVLPVAQYPEIAGHQRRASSAWSKESTR